MRILRHPDEVLAFSRSASSPPWMVELISQRLAELTADGDPMEDLLLFVIADHHTTLADIESVLGHPVLNEAGRPLWEVLEAHPQGYEWVFVLQSSGYGAIVLLPNSPDTDSAVLNLCRFQPLFQSRSHSVGTVSVSTDAHVMRETQHLI